MVILSLTEFHQRVLESAATLQNKNATSDMMRLLKKFSEGADDSEIVAKYVRTCI